MHLIFRRLRSAQSSLKPDGLIGVAVDANRMASVSGALAASTVKQHTVPHSRGHRAVAKPLLGLTVGLLNEFSGRFKVTAVTVGLPQLDVKCILRRKGNGDRDKQAQTKWDSRYHVYD